MQKLYLDCDGVILDTINVTYKMIKEQNLTKRCDVVDFYRNLDWESLIIESGEIDNSIDKIKQLTSYFDVEILTHVNSEREAMAKLKYFKEVLPMINVIPVPKEIEKADYINPNGAILVDDYIGNLEFWHKKGGISIKFLSSEKECRFTVISNLLDVIHLFERNKIKVKN